MIQKSSDRSVLLCILDGWGIAPPSPHNALHLAKTPFWDALWASSNKTTLAASESFVGLPPGQMGNSEVGHMTMGAGRPIWQSLCRINQAIESGELENLLQDCVQWLKKSGGAVHLYGILSDGGVHGHKDHMLAMASILVKHRIRVHIHAFLDGRDSGIYDAAGVLEQVSISLQKMGDLVSLSSMVGRFYAMDRDNRSDRTTIAFDLLMNGEGQVARERTPSQTLKQIYQSGFNDEHCPPILFKNFMKPACEDCALFSNFRSDRARQLVKLCLERAPFQRVITMTDYGLDNTANSAPTQVLFPSLHINNTLGELLAQHNMAQFRIAETEKYAHITSFFNAGRKQPYPGEDRVLIPSNKVDSYALTPDMCAPQITQRLCQAIEKKHHQFFLVNYANPDMLGHTGQIDACIQGVETIDACLSKLYQAAHTANTIVILTSDHGNVECLRTSDGQPHTAHTLNPVPLVIWHNGRCMKTLASGTLACIAPCVLDLLGIGVPQEMTASSLLV